MNELRLKEILKTCPPNTILIFLKDNLYTIHTPTTNIPESTKLAFHQYVTFVHQTLKSSKHNINEYINTSEDFYILDKEATPSNWLAYLDIMNDEFIKPIISILKKDSTIFASFFDYSDQVIYYLYFEDDDILSGLYSFLTEINCYNVVFNDLQFEKTLMNMGMNVFYIKDKVSFKCGLDEEVSKVIGLLVKHLNISDPIIKKHDRKCFMQIDYKTLENLDFKEIIKLIKPETMQGVRLLNQVCRQPLCEPLEIIKRQEYVDALYNFNAGCLKGFPDLIKYSKKVLRLKISDIVVIYRAINSLQSIINSITFLSDEFPALNDFVLPLLDLSRSFVQLISEIEKIINVEEHAMNKDLNSVITDFEQERERIDVGITDEYNRVLEISNKIKIERKLNSNVTFKIPRSEFKILKENNFVELTILKSGILFTTKTLEDYNNVLEHINKEYMHEQKKILDNLLIYMNNYSNSFEIVNYLIAMIDLFHSFSRLRNIGFTKPLLSDKYDIKHSFHPLVQGCIKNSISLADNKKFCVITGPNMGGKSTFIKQCAIISILAQIGCLVPADTAVVPLITGIYVRIGANDLASVGMSTFMVEMNDIARICKNATPSTLIIIDELGRGTSALDGLSLALSIKEFLLDKMCYTMFATHFPELCGEDVLNLKMMCSIDEMLVMLYRIEVGVCDMSLGVEVAEWVGFPREVIEMARKYNQ